jgi:hypothetical protein
MRGGKQVKQSATLGMAFYCFGPRRAEAALLRCEALGALVFTLGTTPTTLLYGRALIALGVSGRLMAAFQSPSAIYRDASGAADSGSEGRASAGSRRLHAIVRRGAPRVILPPPRLVTLSCSPTPAYSSTSSARKRSNGGMVRPSALAVFRLKISSNFVGCSTGKSASLAPFRILST